MVKGFSKGQRNWFLRRDYFSCQFVISDHGILRFCGSTNRLQVHHLIPRRWWFYMLEEDFPINGSENGIVLCEKHHYTIHPDMYMVSILGGFKNGAFDVIAKKRDLLSQEGVPYWDTGYDNVLLETVLGRNLNFLVPYVGNSYLEKSYSKIS